VSKYEGGINPKHKFGGWRLQNKELLICVTRCWAGLVLLIEMDQLAIGKRRGIDGAGESTQTGC
jgi:hypothetical protein